MATLDRTKLVVPDSAETLDQAICLVIDDMTAEELAGFGAIGVLSVAVWHRLTRARQLAHFFATGWTLRAVQEVLASLVRDDVISFAARAAVAA